MNYRAIQRIAFTVTAAVMLGGSLSACVPLLMGGAFTASSGTPDASA